MSKSDRQYFGVPINCILTVGCMIIVRLVFFVHLRNETNYIHVIFEHVATD